MALPRQGEIQTQFSVHSDSIFSQVGNTDACEVVYAGFAYELVKVLLVNFRPLWLGQELGVERPRQFDQGILSQHRVVLQELVVFPHGGRLRDVFGVRNYTLFLAEDAVDDFGVRIGKVEDFRCLIA